MVVDIDGVHSPAEEQKGVGVQVKLPADAVVAKPKVANYLLEWQPENDKSRFLAQAGYTSEHVDQLAEDIRRQLLPLEAEFEESTEYGDKYRIVGALIGPNGRTLRVVSVWMIEAATRTTKFLTLYPAKEA